MQSAFKRHAVAEWRDEQILEAVSVVNRSVQAVRAALDEGFNDATARDGLFPKGLAHARIDELARELLAPSIAEFLENAGRTLGEIDPSLSQHVARLAGLDLTSAIEIAGLNEAEDEEDGEEPLPPEPDVATKPRLREFTDKIVRGAHAIAESAGAVGDNIINDKMGLGARIRARAMRRVEREWHDSNNPRSVLSKLVMAIDAVAASARVSLL